MLLLLLLLKEMLLLLDELLLLNLLMLQKLLLLTLKSRQMRVENVRSKCAHQRSRSQIGTHTTWESMWLGHKS